MEMKKCKECGKLFMPKGRENYCSDKHYRPCPICGEPAEVLYFSDPPRRCDKCRGKKNVTPSTFIQKAIIDNKKKEEEQSNAAFENYTAPNIDPKVKALIASTKPVVQLTGDIDDMLGAEHIWAYIGKKTSEKGFQPGHLYRIKLDKDHSAYIVTCDEDLTDNDTVNIYDRFSSRISLNHNFGLM